MNQKKRATIIVLIVIVLVLAIFGYQILWPPQPNGQIQVENEILKEEAAKLNPFNQENVNPFEESTNPYENIKVNPFE